MSDLRQEIKKRNPFESSAEEAYLNLLRTHSVMSAFVEGLLKQFGLSEPKYNALRILRGGRINQEFAGEGMPCQEIGARMVTRVPDVTRLVDRLEADGLVARGKTSADRRVVLVSITEKGLKLLAEIDPAIREHNARMDQLMSSDEWNELSRLLVKARQIKVASASPEMGLKSERGLQARETIQAQSEA